MIAMAGDYINPPLGVEVVMVCSGAPEVLKALRLCAQFMQRCPAAPKVLRLKN